MLFRFVTALVLAILAYGANAQAAPITFSYDGVVWSALPVSGFQVGDTFNIKFSFESTTPDKYPLNPTNGTFENVVTSVTFSSSNYNFTAGLSDIGQNSIVVTNYPEGAANGFMDEFVLDARFSNNIVLPYIQLKLRTHDLATFHSDELPTSFLSTALFESTSAYLETGSGPFSSAFATLSDPLVTTPIPAALPLFASALGAFGLVGWRKRNRAAAPV